ncbi:hypothetical protein ACIA8C_35470 [Nocardia sp. NPDC051321]|uniref:hypothetical protein n=1 Tax=Nocardia sp. NPDC051321 TaxID=3364323 RepID=UPI00379F027C
MLDGQFEEIFEHAEQQIAALQERAGRALAEFESRTYTGSSDDGRAVVRLSPDGFVQHITLPHGLGISTGSRASLESAWGDNADELAATCAAMVTAINRARLDLVGDGLAALRHEFPEAMELLDDLKP